MELHQAINKEGSDEKSSENTDEVSYRKIQSIVGDTSFSLVLPKKYALNLGIKKGDFVKVIERNGEIVIQRT
ncbi:MAG: AbrB/MazE/SpoVT family DNA-binding domain-containing protein [Thermoproteota archaeon]|nr:AbrB/MazE/SpoVT family DNA-binding domain-containing protein [Thermoproteota archaeon]